MTYSLVYQGDSKIDSLSNQGRTTLIPVCLRKMLKSGAENKLISDGKGGTDHSPCFPFIPQSFSNQRKVTSGVLIQQNSPTQVAKKGFET